MSTSTPATIAIQEQLNIESAFRFYMDEIVTRANAITSVQNTSTELCGRSAAQNLYQVMTQYQSVQATIFWMDYQVSRNTQNKVLFPASLRTKVAKELEDLTIPKQIIQRVDTTNQATHDAINIRYAIQLMAFTTRYIRMRTTNNNQ
jgi:hypothetical protein